MRPGVEEPLEHIEVVMQRLARMSNGELADRAGNSVDNAAHSTAMSRSFVRSESTLLRSSAPWDRVRLQVFPQPGVYPEDPTGLPRTRTTAGTC